MSPLGHVGHVTYSFINMLFISSGIFDDKLVIVLSVVLRYTDSDCPFRIFKLFLIKVHVFPFEKYKDIHQFWKPTCKSIYKAFYDCFKGNLPNFWCMSPLGHVGHVTYSFINMLFISSGIFDDKLRPQILPKGKNFGLIDLLSKCNFEYI
jgi:hypothetical protein